MAAHFLGSVFSENVMVGEKVLINNSASNRKKWWQGAGRMLILSIFLWFGFVVLGARLFQLTIIDGHRLRALADDNRIRELVRHAPRGVLLDRTGEPLVKNISKFRLLSPCPDKIHELCVNKISEEKGSTLKTQGLPPNTFLEVDYEREYTFPTALAHVTGYTGEISESELKDEYYALRKYNRGDFIGRMGTEAVYEEKLKGRNGRELVEVDASGNILRVLGRDPELPGEDVTLSIDAFLSKTVEASFPKNINGTVIVSKPQTGEAFVLFSNPTFSPNSFSLGMSQEEYSKLLSNPNKPLFNRAIGGVYPPGSTYKLVTALAGLETGTIFKDTKIEDTGVIQIGPFSFPNWYFLKYGGKDGSVDLVKALARSNDIYFYKAGEAIGITKIRDWSSKVGIGKPLGIELPGEASGLLPGPEWKDKHFIKAEERETKQNEWYLGDTYHMSIGQGYLLTTPLQVNTWTNIVANGGYFCRPTIQIHNSTVKLQSEKCTDLDIKQETIDLILEGMRQACATGGTGYPLFEVKIKSDPASPVEKSLPVACKTGTAEFGHPQNKTHAWITLFAPIPEKYLPQSLHSDTAVIKGEPEISITVLAEEAGEGSEIAAPIAKKILEYWFSR